MHARAAQAGAAPIFRRTLVSHERALGTARQYENPLVRIAARQLEGSRISHALHRAEELPSDVAAAIEGELDCRLTPTRQQLPGEECPILMWLRGPAPARSPQCEPRPVGRAASLV